MFNPFYQANEAKCFFNLRASFSHPFKFGYFWVGAFKSDNTYSRFLSTSVHSSRLNDRTLSYHLFYS